MKEYLKKLQTTVWRTSGARYNASRRLKRKELFSTISLALFSALSITIAVVQRIYSESIQHTPGLDNLLTALSICMGLLILVYTLMEWGGANGVKAHILHGNAEELNSLQSKIGHMIERVERDQDSGMNWDEAEALRIEYEKIKGLCAENHTPADDELFLMTKRHSSEFEYLKPSMPKIAAAWLIWNISSIWYYSGLWVITAYIMWHAFSQITLT